MLRANKVLIFTVIAVAIGVAFLVFQFGVINSGGADAHSEKAASQNREKEIRNEKEKFVRGYFSEIKTRPLEESWVLLSEKFRDGEDYNGYADWWGEKVESLEIEDVYTSKDNRVNTKIHYKLKDGNEYCSHDMFDVISHNGKFNIDTQKYKVCD